MSSHNKSFMEQLDDDAEMSLSKQDRDYKNKFSRKYRQEVANMLGRRAMLISERQSETPLDEQLHLFMNEEGYFGVDLDALINKYAPSETFMDGSPKYSFQQVFGMLNEIHYGEPMTNYPPKMAMGGTIQGLKNPKKELWEGWTNEAVASEIMPIFLMVMRGQSWHEPLMTKAEVKKFVDDQMPNVKRYNKDVVDYFWSMVQKGNYYAEGGTTNNNKNIEVILTENRPNGAVWQGVVLPFMMKSIEENQYRGGFKRYEIDIYDDVDRNPTKEELKGANEFFDKVGGRYFAEGGRVSKKYMTSKVPLSEYPSLFGDNDGDGIPNVDDVAPMNPKINEQVEEVRLSDEMKTIIEYRNEFDEVREEMVETLEDIVDVCGAKGRCGILSRTKTPYSIINKLRRRSLTDVPKLDKLEKKAKQKLADNDLSGIDLYKGLTDVVGTMVVTPDKESSDKIRDAILSGRVGKVLEFEDMYEDSKAGYRAYHFLVGVEKDGSTFPIEIQVKTQRIKELSDLAHTLYKQGKINPNAFEKLMDLANKGDKGSAKAQKEFAELMQDKSKVKRMITTNSKGNKNFAEGGNVFSMYDRPVVTTEELSNRQIIEPYIPKHIYVDSQEEKLINLPLLANAIETAPEFMSTRNVSDEFMNMAHLHYSNDVAHFFVTEIDKANGLLYGYQIIGEDDDAKFGQLDRSILDQDYNDDLVNWKLDYEFHPQFVNEALKRFGKRNLMSRDVPLTSAFGEDVDIDRIVNTKYTTDNERNRAIVNLMGYLGDNINDYPLEAQNFISNYACGLFRDVITTKLYKTLVGMLYLNAENNDASIDSVICINSCIGNLVNFFDKEVKVTCVDTDRNAVQIGNIINSRENSDNITRDDLQLNPPSERVDGMIIMSDSLDMALTDLSYLLPNGVAVVMCYVDDFETYFATESVQKRFLQGFLMTEKYRVSSDTILLQLKKK